VDEELDSHFRVTYDSDEQAKDVLGVDPETSQKNCDANPERHRVAQVPTGFLIPAKIFQQPVLLDMQDHAV
jgi:hypothetical protein